MQLWLHACNYTLAICVQYALIFGCVSVEFVHIKGTVNMGIHVNFDTHIFSFILTVQQLFVVPYIVGKFGRGKV